MSLFGVVYITVAVLLIGYLLLLDSIAWSDGITLQAIVIYATIGFLWLPLLVGGLGHMGCRWIRAKWRGGVP